MAILEYYQTQVLHLHPSSVLLLAIFAFLCEAFLGVRPSVVLFRHFYELRLISSDQFLGCVTFRLGDMACGSKMIPMPTLREMRDFHSRRVLMEAQCPSPFLEEPVDFSERRKSWGQVWIRSKEYSALFARLAELKSQGLNGAMVAGEFLLRRITPLQEHTEAIWSYARAEDVMRLSREDLPSGILSRCMHLLFAADLEGVINDQPLPLYFRGDAADKAALMPRFDEWGFLKETELAGGRGNPFAEASLSKVAGDLEPSSWFLELFSVDTPASSPPEEERQMEDSEAGDGTSRRGFVISSSDDEVGENFPRASRDTADAEVRGAGARSSSRPKRVPAASALLAAVEVPVARWFTRDQ